MDFHSCRKYVFAWAPLLTGLIGVHSLQALQARYAGRSREEAFHLVKARHWSLGHNVVLRSLVSDAIINGEKTKYNQSLIYLIWKLF